MATEAPASLTPPPTTRPLPLAPPSQRSEFHLTPEQVRFFDENGYLVLRQWVTGELLARLQDQSARWIEHGTELARRGEPHPDHHFVAGENGPVMYRVDFVHDKGPAALELLGSPRVLAVAESLNGPDFVPTYESIVFKQEGEGKVIPWHQDAVHPRSYRIFNLDLYLDPSRVGAGALRVVPRSQNARQDTCAVADAYGWDVPGAVDVEMEPGDVLLHDVMVLHGSERTLGRAMRRTIYYEFRSATEILADGPWDRAWIERRLRLVQLGLARYRAAFGNEPQFEWNVPDEYRPRDMGSEREELRVLHEKHMAGSFCSAGDALEKLG